MSRKREAGKIQRCGQQRENALGGAEEVRYTINTGEIVLTGNACVRMERNRLSADIIRYNVNSGIIVALPRPGSRVKSIIAGDTVSRKN
ncbi:TPA: LptA/OstA family protein [Escherichia coli]|nr:hypothetical protein [Escherichia coli]